MKPKSLLSQLFLALKGAFIGMGAILPGISGGVLCLALGIYRPMMALLANPFKEIRKQFWFFLPVIVGFALGVLGLSRLVDYLFRASPTSATWLFLGLIAGTLPGLWREAGKQGRPTGSLIWGGAAFALAFGGMLAITLAGKASVTPSTLVWLLCGVLWAIGFVVPGMSPSSLFIFMDVYQPMAAGIADLSFPILIPMGIGLVVTILLLSRAVSALFRKFYPYAMHACLGVALAGALIIVPIGEIDSIAQALLYAACFAVGFIAALFMEKFSDKLPSENT